MKISIKKKYFKNNILSKITFVNSNDFEVCFSNYGAMRKIYME